MHGIAIPGGSEKNTTPAALPVREVLKVGSLIFLFPKVGGVEQKVPARLIGWRENEYLVCSLPELGGKPIDLEVGKALSLRYVLNGDVYALNGRVRGKTLKPEPFFLLDYPTQIERVPLRADHRVPVRLPAVISWLPAGGRAPVGLAFGFLRDLTTNGGQLELSVPETADPTGRTLTVSFGVGLEREVRTTALVRNFVRDGKSCRLGVSFNWADPADRVRMETFCRLQ